MNINDYIKANWVLFKQIYNDDIVLDAVRKEINSDSKKLIKFSEALLDGKWSKLEGKECICFYGVLLCEVPRMISSQD